MSAPTETAVPASELVLRPIGFARTPFVERMQAPRQPRAASGVEGRIELVPGHHFEDALCDLEGWQYVWLVFWFHQNEGWRPKVLPPRSTTRRGVFATRSPYRPNPLGLSVVELVRVEGLCLHVRDVDLLDGTPILDIKPYVPWADAIPNARAGWLDDERQALASTVENTRDRPADPVPNWLVAFDVRALEQLAFLRAQGLEVESAVRAVLVLGPQPHAYRRIRVERDGTRRLALKEWRYFFRVDGNLLTVFDVQSGYPAHERGLGKIELEPHRAFAAAFLQR